MTSRDGGDVCWEEGGAWRLSRPCGGSPKPPGRGGLGTEHLKSPRGLSLPQPSPEPMAAPPWA